jgi:hypothetical protein
MVLTHGRSAEGMPDLLVRHAELLRFFGIGGAETQSAFEQDGSLKWTCRDGTAYWSRGERGALLVLANLAAAQSQGKLRIAKPAAVGISPRKRYLVYRPDRERLVGDAPVLGRQTRSFDLSLRPYEPALFFLTPYPGHAQVVWATHSDGIESEHYDRRAGRLSFTVEGAPGGRSQVTLYVGEARVAGCSQGDAEVGARRRGKLVTMEVACNEEVHVTFTPEVKGRR